MIEPVRIVFEHSDFQPAQLTKVREQESKLPFNPVGEAPPAHLDEVFGIEKKDAWLMKQLLPNVLHSQLLTPGGFRKGCSLVKQSLSYQVEETSDPMLKQILQAALTEISELDLLASELMLQRLSFTKG